MERLQKILRHPLFKYHLDANNAAEADRCFCRHNMAHFLDVARIGRIISQEEQLQLPMDIIYAAALLHDMGKHIQYEEGTAHELTGAEIAAEILPECGFDGAETELITEAICCHRDSSIAEERSLRGVLYRADKASRACFYCEAEKMCSWKNEKKNLQLKY